MSIWNKKADQKQTGTVAEDAPPHEHPPLRPNEFLALSNRQAPILISSEGLSSRISFQPETGHYRIVTKSGAREISDETIDPTDRKKKAVTDFTFKGLYGIHLHPSGVILCLDEEKDFRGETSKRQKPAVIHSAPPPGDGAGLRRECLMTIDLNECTAGQPVMVGPNSGKMNLLIRKLEEDDAGWGLFLSNKKGIVREESAPVAVLAPSSEVIIHRKFFTQLAASRGGGLDARLWNQEIMDPVLMRLQVDAAGILSLEEMYTTNGLTVLVGGGEPVALGAPGARKPEADREFRREQAQLMQEVRQECQTDLDKRSREAALDRQQKEAILQVTEAIRKKNRDDVSLLALELSVKEVLSPLYWPEGGGRETAVSIDDGAVQLLNAITGDLATWVEADTSRATTLAAARLAIGQAMEQLELENVGGLLLRELPEVPCTPPKMDQALFDDLVVHARRLLTAGGTARELKQMTKNLLAAQDEPERQRHEEALATLARQLARALFEKTLVRLTVKTHLIPIEKEQRQASSLQATQAAEAPLTDRELNNIIGRYEAYAQYMDIAFQKRLRQPLNALVKEFQEGTTDEDSRVVHTKGFLTFLVAMRTSGGKAAMDSDVAPAASCLQSIPDAIPDIHVQQPDPTQPQACIRVTHREGVLLEAPFTLAGPTVSVPSGVPNPLWFAFQELTRKIMAFYLIGDSQQKRDREQVDAIAHALTRVILLKVLNFFREIKSIPVSDGLDGAAAVLGGSNGVLEMRPGENQEELLDLKPRPASASQAPLNLKQSLRAVLVEKQKAGEIEADLFRFKQRLRSFAMAATAHGPSVVLPITIQAKNGTVTITARFQDEAVFNKSVVLVEERGAAEKPTRDAPTGEAPARKPGGERDQSRLLNLVGRLPFFKRFSDYEKSQITHYDVSFKMFDANQMIIREGTKDTAFFILAQGTVNVLKGQRLIAQLGPGEIFGELAFLTDTPRSMTVATVDKSLVLRVDQEMMAHLGPNSREKFKDQIILKLVARLTEVTHRTSDAMEEDGGGASFNLPDGDGGEDAGQAMADLDPQQVITMIDKVPFFDSFSRYEKRRMTAFNTSFRLYPDYQLIIREGSEETAFYIIVRGNVNIVKGSTHILDLGPGEFFGEMAFLTNTPRTTSVVSDGEVLALRLDQEILSRMGVEIREKIKDKLIGKMSTRLVQTSNMVVQGG